MEGNEWLSWALYFSPSPLAWRRRKLELQTTDWLNTPPRPAVRLHCFYLLPTTYSATRSIFYERQDREPMCSLRSPEWGSYSLTLECSPSNSVVEVYYSQLVVPLWETRSFRSQSLDCGWGPLGVGFWWLFWPCFFPSSWLSVQCGMSMIILQLPWIELLHRAFPTLMD